ncbi:MAG: TIGR03960 family B12-binding radical SAM protein [bacterium]|nr:TIGR03960 family B12-binding radical SAM protein [bacterium]
MKLSTATIEKLLSTVQKPGRYIGGEFNSIVKEEALVRMAICYPDLYEVGMSNNGIRILYDIANQMDEIACERVFPVEQDFEEMLRKEDAALYTLETFTPLAELDILGFNISHELLYTNILQVLDLGKIPLLAADRNDSHPLVIAGGESASNPFPGADFIDAFLVGDGEEGLVDILNLVKSTKAETLSRKELLEKLAQIDGVLVPARYQFTYKGPVIEHIQGTEVRKRVYRERELKDPEKPIVPNIRITQERAVLETARGCYNLCKFCHAGYYDLPYRAHDYEAVAKRLFTILSNTGYNELTLSSLSISDYKNLTSLLNRVLPELTKQGVSISLPSLKVDTRTIPIIEQVSDVRKASITLAVESASQHIRAVANKKVITSDLLAIVETLFNKGWRVIKLYFMLGLPGCDEDDEAEAIIALLKNIVRIGGKGKDINVTLSPFVPKPHTPFQRAGMKDEEYFNQAILKIKQGSPRSVKIKNHNVKSSLLEGIFSRGDSRLGTVISEAYKAGCRFDSWSEHFKYYTWEKTLDAHIPEWRSFLSARDEREILPWSVIKTGFESLVEKRKDHIQKPEDFVNKKQEYAEPLDLSGCGRALEAFQEKYLTEQTIRVRFRKRGFARFIPHLDIIEILKRAFRMTEIPAAFTQGFNKREKLSMGFPLPLGIESEAELADVELYAPLPANAIGALNRALPPGIEITGIHTLDPESKSKKQSLMALTAAVDYRVELEDTALFEKILVNLEAKINFVKKTKKGEKELLFDDVICLYTIDEPGRFTLRLFTATEGSMRIDKVLLFLAGVDAAELYQFRMVKMEQYKRVGEEFVPVGE